MRNNRSFILDLVAVGRVSPAEAERLLAAWNEGHESVWIVALCGITFLLMQSPLQLDLFALQRLTHALSPGHLIHHVGTLLTQTLGGMK